jgi:hypothetical protein
MRGRGRLCAGRVAAEKKVPLRGRKGDFWRISNAPAPINCPALADGEIARQAQVGGKEPDEWVILDAFARFCCGPCG